MCDWKFNDDYKFNYVIENLYFEVFTSSFYTSFFTNLPVLPNYTTIQKKKITLNQIKIVHGFLKLFSNILEL